MVIQVLCWAAVKCQTKPVAQNYNTVWDNKRAQWCYSSMATTRSDIISPACVTIYLFKVLQHGAMQNPFVISLPCWVMMLFKAQPLFLNKCIKKGSQGFLATIIMDKRELKLWGLKVEKLGFDGLPLSIVADCVHLFKKNTILSWHCLGEL